MFTGLVEGVGKIRAVRRTGEDMRITLAPPFPAAECRVGDSISVDGVCLTVTDITGGCVSMDVSGETLSRSTLGLLKQGDAVNTERALRLADRLGGHLVSGHVDGIGRILERSARDRSWRLRIGIDRRLSRYTIEKGSVSVDGISLTVNRTGGTFFEVNVIPQTGRETTLLTKKVGAPVNIETDLIGKYVEKLLSSGDSGRDRTGISMEMLLKQGFGDSNGDFND